MSHVHKHKRMYAESKWERWLWRVIDCRRRESCVTTMRNQNNRKRNFAVQRFYLLGGDALTSIISMCRYADAFHNEPLITKTANQARWIIIIIARKLNALYIVLCCVIFNGLARMVFIEWHPTWCVMREKTKTLRRHQAVNNSLSFYSQMLINK